METWFWHGFCFNKNENSKLEVDMPRTARVKLKGEVAYYFVASHTVWERQNAFTHYEKQHFLTLLRKLSKLFFVDVLAYVIMDNHFHLLILLIRMVPSINFSDEEVLRRIEFFYGPKKIVSAYELPYWRRKLEDLSEFVKYLKQLFAQWYNKRHNRKGHLWSQRFHSVLLQKGEAVIAAAIYTELNPI